MCQLLGMNCNTPTDITLSFGGSRRRGGITDHHADGFGIGFFEGKGVYLFYDDKPSASSPAADLVRAYQIKSKNVIAHTRRASQGQTSLANAYPFMREIWGEYWLFTYSSHLIDFFPEQDEYYHAVGSTDPERVFCFIPNRLRSHFAIKPESEVLFGAIAGLAHGIRRYGLSNLVMPNGDCLFTHASALSYYIVCKTSFGRACLLDDDVMADFSEMTTPSDKVSVIAILPLMRNEIWLQLTVDKLEMFQDGDIALSDRPDNPVCMSAEGGLGIVRTVGVSVWRVID